MSILISVHASASTTRVVSHIWEGMRCSSAEESVLNTTMCMQMWGPAALCCSDVRIPCFSFQDFLQVYALIHINQLYLCAWTSTKHINQLYLCAWTSTKLASAYNSTKFRCLLPDLAQNNPVFFLSNVRLEYFIQRSILHKELIFSDVLLTTKQLFISCFVELHNWWILVLICLLLLFPSPLFCPSYEFSCKAPCLFLAILSYFLFIPNL
jgi:hypothetical protein